MSAKKIGEPLYKLKSDHDYHVYEVYRDPDFIADVNILKKFERQPGVTVDDLTELASAIGQEYAISIAEVNWYKIGTILYVAQKTASATYNYNPENGRYFIEFDIDAPKTEIDEAYAKFDGWRKFLKQGATKRKAPFYPEIVYATFKRRRQNHTFEAIHAEFCDPQSSHYIKAVNSLFDTPDDLRRHYNKHKPD